MVTRRSIETDVLIVGAGPVGLSLAVELGHRGINCVIVEQSERAGFNPRAKTTNVRSRELLRRWGLDKALRDASPIPPDYPSDIIFATRLNGHLLAKIENVFYCAPGRNDLYSAEAQWVPQYVLEEVLRQHVRTLANVKMIFGCRFETAAENSKGVSSFATELATDDRICIESSYVVGADGARSVTRPLIGSEMKGLHAFSRNLNVVFRAPKIAAKHSLGPAIQYWLINGDAPSLVGPMDKDDIWYFIATKLPDGGVDQVDPALLIRRATGLDVDIEIIAKDPWVAHKLVATRYSQGRIFLAGDACHLHPPFGGYGMNMGIGDAVDLGWKLAAVLQGWASSTLLQTYELERKPVHNRVINEADINYSAVGNQFVRPGLEENGSHGNSMRAEVGRAILATKIREFDTLGVVLGYRYVNSPAVIDDGTDPPPEHFQKYQPSAHPGCLAPHLWLRDGTSLYDRFGPGFTLLVLAPTCDGLERMLDSARRKGLPLTVVAVDDDVRLKHLYAARLSLIRPDQHVAWRGNDVPDDVDRLIDLVSCRAATRPDHLSVASAEI